MNTKYAPQYVPPLLVFFLNASTRLYSNPPTQTGLYGYVPCVNRASRFVQLTSSIFAAASWTVPLLLSLHSPKTCFWSSAVAQSNLVISNLKRIHNLFELTKAIEIRITLPGPQHQFELSEFEVMRSNCNCATAKKARRNSCISCFCNLWSTNSSTSTGKRRGATYNLLNTQKSAWKCISFSTFHLQDNKTVQRTFWALLPKSSFEPRAFS